MPKSASSSPRRSAAADDAARRARVGAERRRRTRDAMLESALGLIRERGLEEPMLDDFVAASGMARGTFHNHFGTKEQLMQAAAERVADAIDARILPLFEGVDDPAQRIAIAVRQFVSAVRERPEWGWVLVRTPPKSNAGWSRGMQEGVIADIREGRRRGRFDGIAEQAAVTLGIGALAMALHTVLVEKTPRDFGEAIAALTLRAYGLDPGEAERVARLPMPSLSRG